MADTPVTDRQMQTYRNLMVEIKYRTQAIDSVLNGTIKPIRAKIAEEFCYLQLRLICEVIAIACLVIHGNLKPKAGLLGTYKADWIISELGKLHSAFYPRALETAYQKEADGTPRLVPKTSGFLTRDELQKLWRDTGNKLHRGKAKNILAKDPPLELPKVSEWRNKIVLLLEHHTIVTPNEDYLFYVVMNAKGSGAVATNLFRNLGPTHGQER